MTKLYPADLTYGLFQLYWPSETVETKFPDLATYLYLGLLSPITETLGPSKETLSFIISSTCSFPAPPDDDSVNTGVPYQAKTPSGLSFIVLDVKTSNPLSPLTSCSAKYCIWPPKVFNSGGMLIETL